MLVLVLFFLATPNTEAFPAEGTYKDGMLLEVLLLRLRQLDLLLLLVLGIVENLVVEIVQVYVLIQRLARLWGKGKYSTHCDGGEDAKERKRVVRRNLPRHSSLPLYYSTTLIWQLDETCGEISSF